MKKILNGFVFFLVLSFFKTGNLLAEGDKLGGSNLDGQFEGWITDFLRLIIGLSGIVAAAVLVFNAYLYITASGDEGKIAKATQGITYAIVGLIVAAIAFLLVNFVIGAIEQ